MHYVEQHFHSHALHLADALIGATAVVRPIWGLMGLATLPIFKSLRPV